MKDYTKDAGDRELIEKIKLNILNYFICFLLTVFTVVIAELHVFNWFFLIEVIFIFGCLLVSLAPLFTVLTLVAIALLGLAVNSILLRPLAHLLEHPSLDRFLMQSLMGQRRNDPCPRCIAY